MLPLFLDMQEQGHTAKAMAEFLVSEKEIPAAKEDSAYRSIRGLLKTHTKKNTK
jgi:hypothetical protein